VGEIAARRVAWSTFALSSALLLAALVLEWLTRGVSGSNGFGESGLGFVFTILFALVFWTFPLASFVIATRRPENPIGWLLLAVGLGWSLLSFSTGYGDYTLKLHPGALPAGEAVGWIGEWAWAPPVAITGVFLLLLYPRGRLLGPRWRWVAYLCGIAVAACVLCGAFKPGPMRDAGFPHHLNPFGIQPLEPLFNVLQYAVLVIPLATVAAVVSLVVRFRRADPVERLQIKWLAAAAGLSGLLYAAVLLLGALLVPRGHPEPAWLTNLQGLWFASLALIPVSVGVAVMRYRLFEIDVIIRRTLIYAGLVAVLAVIYLGGVALMGALLRGLVGSSGTLAVTMSTLAVAGAFHPLRRLIQRTVDRRFYRAGYDAQAAVDGFNERLREQIDLDALCAELQLVVNGTVQPTHASIWLRPGRNEATV
jgi:hypothetical protein